MKVYNKILINLDKFSIGLLKKGIINHGELWRNWKI